MNPAGKPLLRLNRRRYVPRFRRQFLRFRMWTPQPWRRQLLPRCGSHRRSIVLLNLQAMAEPTSIIAIAVETVEDGVTEVRDLRRANDPMAPSALPVMAETAARLETAARRDMASHDSVTARPTLRSQFLPARGRPISPLPNSRRRRPKS